MKYKRKRDLYNITNTNKWYSVNGCFHTRLPNGFLESLWPSHDMNSYHTMYDNKRLSANRGVFFEGIAIKVRHDEK